MFSIGDVVRDKKTSRIHDADSFKQVVEMFYIYKEPLSGTRVDKHVAAVPVDAIAAIYHRKDNVGVQ